MSDGPPQGPQARSKQDITLRPSLSTRELCLLWSARAIAFLAVVHVLIVICFDPNTGTDEAKWWHCLLSNEAAYVALTLLLFALLLDRRIPVWQTIHDARLQDPSVVNNLIIEACGVRPRLASPERPDGFDDARQKVVEESNRLESIGHSDWTEYQVLSLEVALVDFIGVEDLIATAQSTLEDLEDYAEDDSYGGYDKKHYGQWSERVTNAIQKIRKVDENNDGTDDLGQDLKRDTAAENLRAVLRTLFEHVASYKMNWAQGSIIYRSLMVVCIMGVPILAIMGLLPVLRSSVHDATFSAKDLSFLNWGFLGVAGSLIGALLAVRRSDWVEVGNTDGKKEVWRAAQGIALGLMAGILAYSLIVTGLLEGPIVPDPTEQGLKTVGLMVLWSVGAGYSFELVFERVRGVTWQV